MQIKTTPQSLLEQVSSKTGVGEDVGKKEPSYTLGENAS
jgi:hypothetical protein